MSDFVSSRDIPEEMRRTLRQEVNFGCAICGCPVIEIHHIIPWAQTLRHNPQDMIALCPTHAHRADMGEYAESYLRELKTSPHNKTVVDDAFTVQTDQLVVSLASNKFENTPRILVVDDFDIISLTKENEFPQLEVNFFDKFDRWIGIVYKNQWFVDTKLVWDVEYRPKHLTIRCTPRNISLELKIIENIIFIRGMLHFNGYTIEATQNDLFLGGKSALQMRGSRFRNAPVGISISTGKSPFSFASK